MAVSVTFDRGMAIKQMSHGVKMTHPYFSKNEWVTIERNKMVFEDGVKCSAYEFWKDRQGAGWNEGWTEFKA